MKSVISWKASSFSFESPSVILCHFLKHWTAAPCFSFLTAVILQTSVVSFPVHLSVVWFVLFSGLHWGRCQSALSFWHDVPAWGWTEGQNSSAQQDICFSNHFFCSYHLSFGLKDIQSMFCYTMQSASSQLLNHGSYEAVRWSSNASFPLSSQWYLKEQTSVEIIVQRLCPKILKPSKSIGSGRFLHSFK